MIYLKLVVMSMFWGASFVAGKAAVAGMPVFSVAFYRFFIALACFALIALRSGNELISNRKYFFMSLFAGATGIFSYNYFFLEGLALTQASKASVIVAVNPVITAIIASVFMKEPLRPGQLAGVFLAFSGVAVIVAKGNPAAIFTGDVNPGDILILGAAVSWSAYTLIGKKILSRVNAMETTRNNIFWGVVLLIPLFIRDNAGGIHTGSPVVWASIAFLGVFATVVGFLFFYEGIRTIGAARAAVFIYFVPLFGVLFGRVLLGEPVGISTIAGGAVVITGVILVNRR